MAPQQVKNEKLKSKVLRIQDEINSDQLSQHQFMCSSPHCRPEKIDVA